MKPEANRASGAIAPLICEQIISQCNDKNKLFRSDIISIHLTHPCYAFCFCLFFASNSCFLQIGNTFYFAQLLIMGLIIVYNIVIFILVMYRITCGRKARGSSTRSDSRAEILKRVHNAIAITALLGLTWVFGLLSLIDEQASFVFQVLFCIFNSLQGCVVFIMFCVRQKNVVLVWKDWFSFNTMRARKSGKSEFTSSATSGAASTTLDIPLKKTCKTAGKDDNDYDMSQFQCTYVPPTTSVDIHG